MKKKVLNLVLISGLAISTFACKNDQKKLVEAKDAQEATAVSEEEADSYKIDTTTSTIKWLGSKPTGEHVGTIDIQKGTISATSEKVTGGNVVIDMTSITVTDEGMEDKKRDNLEAHLKGTVEGKENHFFNVSKYPTATFEITGLSEENGQKMLEGNLTIKEDTKNIHIPVNTTITGDEISIESETFTIDRTDWKVNYGSKSVFDDLGDSFINDDIELTISVKAKKA